MILRLSQEASINLEKAIESLADEMKELRHGLRDDWLRVVVQDPL